MARQKKSDGAAIPSGRLTRFAKFGGLATRVAGDVAASGARRWAQGDRPELRDLVLTPANAARVTEQLSELRGAAMKLGQLLSMDAGEMLPPELADILARLRADAAPMPSKQLRATLDENWGKGWIERFHSFDMRPVAAASIGQVHRAKQDDGTDLAIKIQYPGIARSIDSDVDNVATLINLSGLVPKGLDLKPFLNEAKKQLKDEADYVREGDYVDRFHALLKDHADYAVPRRIDALTTTTVLAMTYQEGVSVETMEDAPQAVRNRIIEMLLALLYKELFDFRLMQTDPNFANYRYDPLTDKLVLLDFGATREITKDLSEKYRALLRAGRNADREALIAAALEIGYVDQKTLDDHGAAILGLLDMAMEPLQRDAPFDFGNLDLSTRMREASLSFFQDAVVAKERRISHVAPTETMFLQRKFAGVFLLASRLKAKVNLRALIDPYLG
ncbi:MAG: AarF/ABC1/UbiB kinase family protein [Pseudomonadota bacterium]